MKNNNHFIFYQWHKNPNVNLYNENIKFPYKEKGSGVLYDLPEKWHSSSDPDVICSYDGKPIKDGQWIIVEAFTLDFIIVDTDVAKFIADSTFQIEERVKNRISCQT